MTLQNQLQSFAQHFQTLKLIEKKTDGKVKPEYSIVAVFGLVLLTIIFTNFGSILTNVFGIIIPLKRTLAVLRQSKPNQVEVRHLLIFWICYAFLGAVSSMSGFILRFIPLYFMLKFLFLIFIGTSPNRTDFVYENVIKFVPKNFYNTSSTEEMIKSAADVAQEMIKNAEMNVKKAELSAKPEINQNGKKNK